MAWYYWVLIGLGALVVLSLIWRGRFRWPWQTPSGHATAGSAPAYSSEKAEEEREEAKEELADEKEAIKEKYDKEREDAEKWLRGQND